MKIVKGFIEVVTDYNELVMINVNAISSVWNNSTYTFITYNDSGKQESIRTNASYEEIKTKIDEAQI